MIREGKDTLPWNGDFLSKRTWPTTKDAFSGFEGAAWGDGRVGRYPPREFGTEDERKGRVRLVLPLRLQNLVGKDQFGAS
jgi:hypothetical protein